MPKKNRKMVEISPAFRTALEALQAACRRRKERPPSIPAMVDEAIKMALPALQEKYAQP